MIHVTEMEVGVSNKLKHDNSSSIILRLLWRDMYSSFVKFGNLHDRVALMHRTLAGYYHRDQYKTNQSWLRYNQFCGKSVTIMRFLSLVQMNTPFQQFYLANSPFKVGFDPLLTAKQTSLYFYVWPAVNDTLKIPPNQNNVYFVVKKYSLIRVLTTLGQSTIKYNKIYSISKIL